MKTGWQTVDGKKYYFDSNGPALTGLVTFTDGNYYFGTDGVMRTGIQKIDGRTESMAPKSTLPWVCFSFRLCS